MRYLLVLSVLVVLMGCYSHDTQLSSSESLSPSKKSSTGDESEQYDDLKKVSNSEYGFELYMPHYMEGLNNEARKYPDKYAPHHHLYSSSDYKKYSIKKIFITTDRRGPGNVDGKMPSFHRVGDIVFGYETKIKNIPNGECRIDWHIESPERKNLSEVIVEFDCRSESLALKVAESLRFTD